MHTVAFPATAPPSGNLTAATSGSTAASIWNGPSMSSSGAIAFASFVASITFSIFGPLFESPVAYESIATRGATPNARAVAAAAPAISASSSALGSTLIAQSA